MKKCILACACALLSAFSALPQVLTIGECVSLAREHYPSVAQYGILEKVADLNLQNISRGWLPQGSVGAQITWQNDVAALPDVLTGILAQNGVDYPGMQKTQYRLGVDISQQIWDGGRISAGKKSIEASRSVEKASLDVQLYDVEGRVEEIYFSLLLIRERIKRTDKTIEMVDSTLRQVKAMLANGVAMQSDCDQIEAKLLTIEQQKSRLTATYASVGKVLEILIGESIGERTLQLPPADIDTASGHYSPRMNLFNSRLANLSAAESGVRSSVMPTIGAFISGYYGYPGYNMFKNMQSHDMSFNFMAGLKVAWNFGSLYTRKNSLDCLGLQRSQIETERAVFNFNNDLAISEGMGQITALRDVMRNDGKIVELRRSVMKAAGSQLRNGIIDATALLTKITDVELAENDLAQHRIELVKAIYNLNHIKNK